MTKTDMLLLVAGITAATIVTVKGKRVAASPAAAPPRDPSDHRFRNGDDVTRLGPIGIWSGGVDPKNVISKPGWKGNELVSSPYPGVHGVFGIGDNEGPVTSTTYVARCRARGVRADASKVPIFDRGSWQGNIGAQGFPNVVVQRVALVGYENRNDSTMLDSPTVDIVLDVTFTTQVVPGTGMGATEDSGFLNSVLNGLAKVGKWITGAVNFIVETIKQIAQAVGSVLAAPVNAVAGIGLVAVGGAALVLYMLGKSRMRTSRVAFGD